MFNPNQLFKHNYTASSDIITRPSRVVLDRMTDHTRSRWDEPINVPEILYMKFRIPPPPEVTSKQSNRYPLQLIDFIKRAYKQCKDQSQSKLIENELKAVLSRYQNNYNSVDWTNMPLPSLNDQKRSQEHTGQVGSMTKSQTLSKKQTVNLHKQHSDRQSTSKDDETSKAQMKVNLTLQRLEQKLNKKQSEPEPSRPYIGFRNEPITFEPPKLPSNIKPGLRVTLNPPPPPPHTSSANRANLIFPPPPPPSKPGNESNKSGRSNPLDYNFSKSNERPIEVVTSIVPEPMGAEKSYKYERERMGRGNDKADKDSKKKVKITQKQLTQISKVAEKVSNLHQVAKRYEQFNKLKQETNKSAQDYDDYDDDTGQAIVGRNTSIDKPYLRITGRPDPDTVRPEPVLKKALPHFIEGFKKGSVPYDNFISQMKSIRQDLTVQHIRTAFTVEVYEQNLKISLFQNDIIQVKNCQANLWELYKEGIYRSKELRSKYISYHFVSLIMEEKYKELEYMLTLLPGGSIDNPDIQNSLKQALGRYRLKQIYMLGNYRAFFDFYNQRDNVCRQLLNIYIDKVRMRCLVMFSKTCGQKITFRLLGETIGQDEDVLESLAQAEGAAIRQGFLMLKQSYQSLSKSEILVVKKVTNLLV